MKVTTQTITDARLCSAEIHSITNDDKARDNMHEIVTTVAAHLARIRHRLDCAHDSARTVADIADISARAPHLVSLARALEEASEAHTTALAQLRDATAALAADLAELDLYGALRVVSYWTQTKTIAQYLTTALDSVLRFALAAYED